MKLWAMRTKPLTAGEAAHLLAVLPPTLRERLCADGEPRQRSLGAYSLLRYAFRETYGREMPEITWSPEGKPGFLKRADMHFNISHTEDAVLVGISDQEIGVDIEKDREPPARLRKLLQAEEEAFYATWVRWEACAKCQGRGVLSLLREGAFPEQVRYQPLKIFPGYWAGVAVLGEVSPPLVRYVEPEQLFDKD